MRKFNRLLKTVAVVLLAGASAAQAVPKYVDVQGSGPDCETALNRALTESVRQVYGVSLSSQQLSSMASVRTNKDREITSAVSSATEIGTKGVINSYEITDRNDSSQGCEISATVNVEKYKQVGLSTENRRKLAVLPFSGNRRFGSELTRELEDLFTQSRRFAVLDRSENAAYYKEKAIWESDDTPAKEKAKLGQMLGLDYILVGEIVSASDRMVTQSLTGETKRQAQAVVNYQIILVATRQVKWSDTVTVEYNEKSADSFGLQVARRISGDALGNIFPMRVVGMNSGQVLLNQGGKTMKVGSHFNVFALGEVIRDPYTKESLGRSESRVATIRVTNVTVKMSYAELIDGNPGHIKKGFIVRPGNATASPYEGKATVPAAKPVDVPSAGGVIL